MDDVILGIVGQSDTKVDLIKYMQASGLYFKVYCLAYRIEMWYLWKMVQPKLLFQMHLLIVSL